MKIYIQSFIMLISYLLLTVGAEAQSRPPNMVMPSLSTEPVITREGISKHIVDAENHIRRGQFELAIIKYDEALAWDPYDVELLIRRGELKYRIGRFTEARQDYALANRINPYLADLFNANNPLRRLELIAFDMSEYYQVESSENSVQVLQNQSIDKKMQGDILGALEDIEQAIYNSPVKLAPLYKIRGNLHLLLGNHYEAEADYTEALRIQPDFLEAQYNRGIARVLGNKRQDACMDFMEVHRNGYTSSQEPIRYLCSK
jgi:tetratricopeptide (TPR) repeat protein